MKRTAGGTGLEDVQEFIKGRDCEYEAFLDEGQYVVLPRTNGIALKRSVGTAQDTVTLLNEKGELSDLFEGTLEDIYYRLDTMISNSIDFEEFKEFYDSIGEPITAQAFSQDVLGKYCSTPQGLTLKGFKEYFKDQVRAQGEDKIWDWMSKLGYDRELYSSFSRSFILTMHSDQPITLEVGDTVSTNLEQAA